MKFTAWHTIVLIGCFFLCSCSSKNDLSVISKNFESEIEQQQNLTFTFNKDLVPDSLLNSWDTSVYIEFTPAIKGMFKWNSASELSFSPAEGFLPATEYTAKLTKVLLKHSKKHYGINTDEIHFHTAPLKVASTHVSWTRGKNVANVMVQMDIEFNYEVNLNEAANKLKLSSEGNPISISAINNGNGKVLSLQFMPVNDKDESTPLKTDLAKGIPIIGTKNILGKDTSFVTQIPSRFNLTVTSVTAQHTGNDGIITVSTSQPVLEKDLKSKISIEPAVPFEVSMNDAGFTITSNQFSPTQTYELTISNSLEGAFGGKMKNDYLEQVTFGKLRPSISFINSKGMYLSAAGYKNLALNIINVPAVEVTVIKVYENNLEQFMRNEKSENYNYDENENESTEYEYYNTENLGDTIFHKDYETSKLPHQSAAHILKLDFQDKIKDYNGVYVIRVKSKEHNWVQESKVLSISDIGLIVKEEKDNMYVFANSIHSATALPGVKVSFISTNNQKLYTAITDADGVAIFKDISTQSPGFKVGMVTAKMNDEFTFVFLQQAQIGTSRFDVGGRHINASGLNAMIYPERNLYRPGETIHVSTVIRDDQWNTPGEVPVKIRLTMPNGKEFATMRKILNEQGSCEASFTPPVSAMTGTYDVNVYTGNDVLLNSYKISVEDFVPDRMKVTLKTEKTEYRNNETVNTTIQADNLFGTPAAGRNYECELNMDKQAFSPDKFPDYNFNISNDFHFNTDQTEGKTDDKGNATESFELGDLEGVGMLKGNIMATVFDETGRPVHRYANFTVYTQSAFAGIRHGDSYVSSRQPQKIGLVVVDKNGNAQTTEVQVVFLRKIWHTVIQKNGNSYRYVSESEEKLVTQQKIKVSGTNTSYYVTPQESGEYEVRVFLNGSNNYVSRTLYAYGWNDTQYSSFEVNNEGNVDIKPDKKTYNIGDNVNVLFTTPFEGRMLVTLERDHVIKYYYLNTKNKSATLSFNADEALLPNVYITATLIRPMGGDDLPLTVAHGFKSVPIENKNNILPVKLTVAEKSRSKTKQTIHMKTSPGAFVTIAAVDEGILQVKNFETPSPYDFFYQKMALDVNSYDIYPWLLPEVKGSLSSTGGDGADNSNMRVNPMFVNRIKNVSFWSGIMQADGGGNVTYEIDVPQFSGDIRVMALAYKGKAFGSADAHMKVADPIIISTALPRFLSPKDEVVMPVSLSNTTPKTATAVISVKISGPLNMKGDEEKTIEIPANREQRVVFNIAAQQAIGAGRVTVTVKAFNETFVNETEIGVRPPASLQKQTSSGFIAENTTSNIDIKNNFIPSSISGKLIVGASPLIQFSKNINDLVRYPYGCVEQTTSAAFPQLYYADLVKSLNGTTDKSDMPSYNVQQAITKLQSMQENDGGLSYWPEGGEESWWGSIYACHFLIEAKKAGYDVNPNVLDRLEQYMKFKLYKKEVFTFFYNGIQKKDVAPEEVSYSLYVLSLAGQAQQATMNYYKAHQELLTLDGKYLLAAAYTLAGQPSQSKEVLPSAFAGETPNSCFNSSFYSYIRDQALALTVMLDIDPNGKQVGIMARNLSDQIKKERYLSTQENSFSMLALGKIARMANKTTATATVTANGRKVGSSTGQPFTLDVKAYANDVLSVQVKGKGGYYYFAEIDGITSDGSYKEEDSHLRVRRTFYDREGNELGNTFRQNDLIIVRISIETEYNEVVNNVAITDMLPAGFEIENTRLSEMPAIKWITNEATPDYMDIRDDRINLFTTVGDERNKEFYYMVRAVSPGVYQLGPVQADAMYNGSYHSYNGAGVVRISEK